MTKQFPHGLSGVDAALSDVARLFGDGLALRALTEHFTAREVLIVARLFWASGDVETYEMMVEDIIHGDEEVGAVATPIGPGRVRVDYYKDFCDDGVAEAPFYTKEFAQGGLKAALGKLRLAVDGEQAEWAAVEIPGRILLCSGLR